MKATKSFNKVFYILSFFYIIYFYIIPLLIAIFYNMDNMDIVYDISVNSNDIQRAFFSLVLFVIGFLYMDFIKFFIGHKHKHQQINKSLYYKNTLYFYILLFLYILILLSLLLDPSRTENAYMMRRDEIESSWLTFLLTIILNSIKLSLLLVMLNNSKRIYIFFFLIFSTYVEFLGSIGRLNLLLDLILIWMLLLKIKAFKMSILITVGTLIFLPILFELKAIIYYLSTGNFSDFSNLSFQFNYNKYINNFGHPLVSILNADNLIDNLGYRYMYDYLQGFLFYLKVIGLDFGASLTYYNTDALIGEFKSIIPPGFLAFGYIQLGYIGVVLAGMVYRLFGFLSLKVFLRVSPYSEVSKFLLAFMAANTFYHGEIRIIILTFLFPLLFSFIISPILQKKYKESN